MSDLAAPRTLSSIPYPQLAMLSRPKRSALSASRALPEKHEKGGRRVDVIRWLTGYGLSVVGDQVYFVVLSWTAVQLAGHGEVGMVMAAGAVGRAALLLVGGAVADRFGAMRVTLVTAGMRVAVMSVIALVVLKSGPSIAHLVVLTMAFGAIDGLFLPAAGSLPALLVRPDEIVSLQSVRALVQHACTLVGPAIAGYLVSGWSASAIFALLAAVFGASVIALALTRLPAPRGEPPVVEASGSVSSRAEAARRPGLISEVVAGMHYVGGHQLLMPMLVVVAVVEIAIAGPLDVGVPLLSHDRGWGAEGVGWLLAAFGTGAGVAAVSLTIRKPTAHAGLVSLLALVVTGPALTLLGSAQSLHLAVLAAFTIGAGTGVCGSLLSSFVLTVSAPAQVGRVVGLMALATFAGDPIAFAATGYVSQAAHPAVVFTVAGATISAVGIVALLNDPLRHAELPV
ncbi:MFS transporter [Clavibacter michiganensis subsp. insidiosus]|uniref:MFS transporter n=1 Tax=Clavibacter michiganensis subsp. insidiosus TaxID=33014 RepID=A0A399SQ80_9MICO|nr:MFS transporter [Clavibacter michiganensis subsp. insidiosus]